MPLAPHRVPGRIASHGILVGRNVAIEYRFSEGRLDRLLSIAAELIGLPAAVLVATDSFSAVAAKKATSTIPIVFTAGGDPVQLGLVESVSRPARNATGAHVLVTDLIPKRLELIREILPKPGVIAFLVGPETPGTPVQLRQMEAAAQAIGQPILILYGRTDDEVENAFATMAEREARGVLYGVSTYFQVISDKLVALAHECRLADRFAN